MVINGTFLTQRLISDLEFTNRQDLENEIRKREFLLSIIDRWHAMTPKKQHQAWAEASNDDTQDLFE